MFLLFRKACLLHKTSKIVSSRFIFTIYDMGIQGVTRGCRELQEVTKGYKGWQGVTRGYRGLQGVKKDYRNFFLTRTFPNTFSSCILHKIQSCQCQFCLLCKSMFILRRKAFFLTRTSPNTFSGSILHKIPSWRNLKFLTKTMD